METYKINDIYELIKDNPYVGRGIVAGKSSDGKRAMSAYFIMGRSANSRNRIFRKEEGKLITEAFDPSKVEDPSLIIYTAVRRFENNYILTNGDQTDTIYEGLEAGLTFERALESRCFEPDAPNFTPRISVMLTFSNNDFSYQMSILKSIDEAGSGCARYNFKYPSVKGLGHFIHTYECDGDPLPTFRGEPERVSIPDDIDVFANNIWNGLNEENKISLFASSIDLMTMKKETRIINKNN